MLLTSEINLLRSEVALMARKAMDIYDQSVQCLASGDEQSVARIRAADSELDTMELNLDQRCMELLLLREPYAIDFRFVFSAIKITRELERVGDQSKSVAKWSLKLKGAPGPDMMELAAKAREALDTAIQALIESDAKLAAEVMQIEFQVDAIEDRIIESAPGIAEAFIAKALERIGDLATNIAENVIFTVNATDIRHGQYENPPEI
ncbi:MAG: phosphate signaling complex protein PhoU [bacterium]|nr:phosphate signaling complex protein PhoU [bacterium]